MDLNLENACTIPACTSPSLTLAFPEKRYAATMVLKLIEDNSNIFNNLEYTHGNIVVSFDEALTCLYELLLPVLVSNNISKITGE